MAEKDERTDQEKALERVEVQLKGVADVLEGVPETVKEEVERRVQEITGDAKGQREEMEEKLTAVEERLTAAIQEQQAPENGNNEEREEDYGYGNEAGGFDDMVAEVRAAGQGMGIPERLSKMHKGEVERRSLDTLTGTGGGFWMRPQFSDQLLQIPPNSQFLSSLIRELPPTDPPNAEFTFNAFDQSGSKGVYGGVAVYSSKELADVTETNTPTIMQVSFKPEKTGVFWSVSEEASANIPQMGSMMQPLVNGAIMSYRDDKIQTGTGAGEFKGFASSPAMISIARSVASQVNYVDLVNMIARMMSNGGGSFVWVCQRVSMLPQLATLTDGAGQLIYTRDANSTIPTTSLMGMPIFFNEISPTLGTQGDLRLLNLDYYMRKPGMGATLKSDNTYGNFKSGEETLRVVYYDDAKPWITSALTLRDGTNTVSPFIELTDVA